MNLDILIFRQINNLAGQWPHLDAVGIFFAKYAGYVLVLILFLLLLRNIKKNWPMAVKLLVAAVLSRGIITETIRWVWPRLRPFAENNVHLILPRETVASFPSGHATFYFAVATVVYFYNKKLGIIFFAASVLMGLARIFGGVHWPSDILAGALIGIFSGWLVMKISKRF